jgi:hypothetical protein
MKIQFLNLNGDTVPWLQWSRFKRREESLFVFVWIAVILHVVFWLVWHFFVAPYPIALTIPLPFDLGPLMFMRDYVWPLTNTGLLVLNTVLAFRVYRKDIFASWLLIGASIFIQVLLLAVTFYLMSFVTQL